MIKAYVLVQTEVGRSGSTAESLRGLQGVVGADEVSGPYEIVALVEAPDVKALGRLVTREIQQIPGIARTVTCTVHSD